MVHIINKIYFRTLRYLAIWKSVLLATSQLSNRVSVLSNYVLKKSFVLMKFKNGRHVSVARGLILELLFLAYSHKFFPISHYEGTLILNNGSKISDKSGDIFFDLLLNKGWVADEDHISKNGITYFKQYGLPSIYDMYEEDMYSMAVYGKIVVDIGASVGDSPIYFASKGAKRVIAFEPLPSRYRLALKNIELNEGLKNKIEIRNVAIGTRDSVIEIMDDNLGAGTKDLVKINCIALSTLVKEIDEPYLLKIDCEGCEYLLVLESYESIRQFERIILEYHPGIVGEPVKIMLRKLIQDFICHITRGDNLIGIMTCARKSTRTNMFDSFSAQSEKMLEIAKSRIESL